MFCVLCFSCVSRLFIVALWAYLLACVGDVYCIFETFPCGILGQMWYLIVSLSDFSHLSYFVTDILHIPFILM